MPIDSVSLKSFAGRVRRGETNKRVLLDSRVFSRRGGECLLQVFVRKVCVPKVCICISFAAYRLHNKDLHSTSQSDCQYSVVPKISLPNLYVTKVTFTTNTLDW